MRLYRSGRIPWVEGKGYWKRPLITEEELGLPNAFLQEVTFDQGQSVPLHHHKKTKEIFIALDPGHFLINGEDVAMEPNDVLICEPGDVHGNATMERAFRILVLKLDFDPDDTVWL
jgi:quercetin dioxygenase-like cupin family protein